jgi:hypothetical protein
MMYRRATLLSMGARLAVSSVVRSAAAAKKLKTTLASEGTACNGTVDEQGTAKSTDDTCLVIDTYRKFHPQGWYVYHEKTTVYDRNFDVIDMWDVITGCQFSSQGEQGEPDGPLLTPEQCDPNILI